MHSHVPTATQVLDAQILRHALRNLSTPARRHRCELCKEIFACHLCTVEADHNVHWDQKSLIACYACIETFELWVVATQDKFSRRFSDRQATCAAAVNRFGTRIVFWDHVTGERLGFGTIRRTGYQWGASNVGVKGFSETSMGRSGQRRRHHA